MNAAQVCLDSLLTSPRSHRLQPVRQGVQAGCVPCSQLQLIQPARLYNSLPATHRTANDRPQWTVHYVYPARNLPRVVVPLGGPARTLAGAMVRCRAPSAWRPDNATYRTRRATTLAGSRAGADPGQGHDLPVGLQTGDGKPRDRGLAPAQQPGPDACLLQIKSSSWAGRDPGRSSAGRTDDALAPCG